MNMQGRRETGNFKDVRDKRPETYDMKLARQRFAGMRSADDKERKDAIRRTKRTPGGNYIPQTMQDMDEYYWDLKVEREYEKEREASRSGQVPASSAKETRRRKYIRNKHY